MRQGHFLLVFLFLYCSCFLMLYCEQKNYDNVMEEKERIEQALLEATEYTAHRYMTVMKESEEKKKEMIEEAFSEAFYVMMDLFQSTEPEEFWRIYIPMIILVEEDGAYFYYVQEAQKQGVVHEWTDKIPFDIPDNYNPEDRKASMINTLEETASQIISNHNLIAQQYGISYRYSVPAFFPDAAQSTEFPMLFVVFQGWPLNASGTTFYENCLDAGVFIREKTE